MELTRANVASDVAKIRRIVSVADLDGDWRDEFGRQSSTFIFRWKAATGTRVREASVHCIGTRYEAMQVTKRCALFKPASRADEAYAH